jgi:heme/copper-type cytochrome/quinol oxidase subunit 3
MTAVTGPTLALPSAGGGRARSVQSTTALLASAGGLMFFGALLGTYLHLRAHAVGPWPPKDAKLDNYLGNMLVITMLLSSVTVEWGAAAVRRGLPRQATAAYGITIGFAVAFLNLLSFAASKAGYGIAADPYATVVGAMAVVLGILVLVGVGFAALTLFRVVGSQVSAAEPDQARALGWYWQFTVVASVAVWFAVVILE